MSERLQLPFRLVLADPQKFKKDAEEYFIQHKKLKAVRFGFTTDYAESLEYGTGPLSNYQPTVHHGNYTYRAIYNEIYNWAGKKQGTGLPIEDPEERAKFAKKITDRFFTYGMRPHPYWRPALQFIEDHRQELFDKGYSLYEIADEGLRVALKCIMDQNMPFSGNLQLSAFIDSVEENEESLKELKDYSEEEKNNLFKKAGWD